MDTTRIEAILRSACAVLDFDIGELWCAKKSSSSPRSQTNFSFLQLHTSPTYEDKYSLLIHPNSKDNHDKDEDTHVFSPILCRGVCDGGQIVWANTRLSAGLTGKSEMPLNTAVGIPLCSIDNDLYIIVLFSVKSLFMNPNAIEFLSTLSRAVYAGETSGFLPTSTLLPVKPANAELFVGIWDMMEFVKKYSSEIAFHLLPIDRLETFFAYQEASVFKDLYFSKQNSTERLKDDSKERSDSICSQGWAAINSEIMDSQSSQGWGIINEPIDNPASAQKSSSKGSLHEKFFLKQEQQEYTQSFQLERKQESENHQQEQQQQYKSDNNMYPSGPQENTQSYRFFENHQQQEQQQQHIPDNNIYPNGPIDVRKSYKKEQSRFHEFMVSMLEMTYFDSAELWLLSDQTNELYVVAALHRHKLMQTWISQSEDLRFKKGIDMPGYIWEMGRPHWDEKFNTHDVNDPAHPRARTAAELNIRTAFGVPLPGPICVSGVLVLYSMKEINVSPTMIDFVLRASQLLSAIALDPTTLTYFDIESIIFAPQPKLLDWYSTSSNVTSLQVYNNNQTLDTNLKVNFMGSLSNFVWGRKNEDGRHCKRNLLDNNQIPVPKRRKDDYDELERRSVDSLLYLANNIHEEKKKKLTKSNSRDTLETLAKQLANEINASNEISLCSQTSNTKRNTYAGSRKCQFEGCTKCAQGNTFFCISHGGGRRCTYAGCTRAARDKFFCAGHGGGSRCQIQDCSKAAVGGSHLCTAHGGGKRCQVEGCTKSSQSNTMLCVRHGGGRKCAFEGCSKVARGKTDTCAAHSR